MTGVSADSAVSSARGVIMVCFHLVFADDESVVPSPQLLENADRIDGRLLGRIVVPEVNVLAQEMHGSICKKEL